MKWIDQIVKNGSYPLLKTYTETAKKHNVRTFEFMGEKLLTTYADHICTFVDLEYTGHYLFIRQERDRWAQYSDKNRVTLRKARDGWKIVSGL